MVRNQPPYEGDQPLSGEDPRQFREQAQRGREKPIESAQQVGEQIRQKGESYLEQQKQQVASEFHHLSDAFRAAAGKLHEKDDSMLARYCESASEQVKQVASYLDNRSVGACVSDLQDLARRRPEMVLGGALVLGVALARFFKASQRFEPVDEQGYAGEGQAQTGGSYQGESVGGSISHAPGAVPPGPEGGLRDPKHADEVVTGASPLYDESQRPGYPPQRPETSSPPPPSEAS